MLLSPCFPVSFINWDIVCWKVFDCVYTGCALVGAVFPATRRAHVCLPSCSGRATVPEPDVWKWWWRLCLFWFHVFQELLPVLESPLTCWVCMALAMTLQNECLNACGRGRLKLCLCKALDTTGTPHKAHNKRLPSPPPALTHPVSSVFVHPLLLSFTWGYIQNKPKLILYE